MGLGCRGDVEEDKKQRLLGGTAISNDPCLAFKKIVTGIVRRLS